MEPDGDREPCADVSHVAQLFLESDLLAAALHHQHHFPIGILHFGFWVSGVSTVSVFSEFRAVRVSSFGVQGLRFKVKG